MPDVYNQITELDPAVARQLAEAMELRARDPAQQAMLAAYLDGLDLPDRAAVAEIGCGTGAISRVLAARPGVGEVTGVDPSPVFLDRARELSAGWRTCRSAWATGATCRCRMARSTWPCCTPC
jgi:SAM-dependent methyltransferase